MHLIIIDKGEILSFFLTKGNVDDRNVEAITTMAMDLFSKLFGEKGYFSKALADQLWGHGIQLIAAVKRNMKSQALSNEERIPFKKKVYY